MIPEDLRTFAQFYPEPEARHRVHYRFAHRFLPEHVHQNPFAFLTAVFRHFTPGPPPDGTRFIQSRWSMIFEPWWDQMPNPPTVFRRVTDLSLSRHAVAGKPVALIQMPAPEAMVEAFFVAVVLLADVRTPEHWSPDAHARVFTLEMLDERDRTRAVVCEWTREGVHCNYGVKIAPDREAFLPVIATLLGTPETLPSASFHPGPVPVQGAINLGDIPPPPQK